MQYTSHKKIVKHLYKCFKGRFSLEFLDKLTSDYFGKHGVRYFTHRKFNVKIDKIGTFVYGSINGVTRENHLKGIQRDVKKRKDKDKKQRLKQTLKNREIRKKETIKRNKLKRKLHEKNKITNFGKNNNNN